jgi:hypothetical protein
LTLTHRWSLHQVNLAKLGEIQLGKLGNVRKTGTTVRWIAGWWQFFHVFLNVCFLFLPSNGCWILSDSVAKV